MGPLSCCYLGFEYLGLCKVPRNLLGVILTIRFHTDVWISFVRLRVSPHCPSRVSKKSFYLHLSI
jgi:hypothetical protein